MENLLGFAVILLVGAAAYFYSEHKKEKAIAHAASVLIAKILLDEFSLKQARDVFQFQFDEMDTFELSSPKTRDSLRHKYYWIAAARRAIEASRFVSICVRKGGTAYPDPDESADALAALLRNKFERKYR